MASNNLPYKTLTTNIVSIIDAIQTTLKSMNDSQLTTEVNNQLTDICKEVSGAFDIIHSPYQWKSTYSYWEQKYSNKSSYQEFSLVDLHILKAIYTHLQTVSKTIESSIFPIFNIKDYEEKVVISKAIAKKCTDDICYSCSS